ncbi:hypothetical protein H4696_000294 [Amycolatopsis lexingtonensis]|uniref:Uncharacterized protein n=1 Tax=Amycolatopsis lexingtonensis TaxID=218822 RepID=A0ABR9HQJ8_9PSEU|nr:hypothetical protein [Amycolatopsis lexingtonensis]MBE1493194.1 hypothetical protein [Amycolatopsis lexingtonensis]
MFPALLPDALGRTAESALSHRAADATADRALGVLRRRGEPVRWHGRDEMAREYVHPGRTVIEVPNRPWPIGRPEDCDERTSAGLWFDATGTPQPDPDDRTASDGVALLCRRCGLDCT